MPTGTENSRQTVRAALHIDAGRHTRLRRWIPGYRMLMPLGTQRKFVKYSFHTLQINL